MIGVKIMCDYSLHVFPNRLAVEGEDLVIHRFGGATIGLASPADLGPTVTAIHGDAVSRNFRTRIKTWFVAQRPIWDAEKKIPAVCVPPGATLILHDIPKGLRRELGVGEVEQVRFVETTADVNTHRDAVRFLNGRQVLLQVLREGQRVRVLSLNPQEIEETVLVQDRF
jgi:hypothetical protein